MAIMNMNKRASEIHFDNRNTTMEATTVQEALEELARNIGLGAGSSTVETCTVYVQTYGYVGCTFKYYDENNSLQTVAVEGYSEESFTVRTDTDIQVVMTDETQIEFNNGNDSPEPEYGAEGTIYTVHIPAGTDVYRINLQ